MEEGERDSVEVRRVRPMVMDGLSELERGQQA